MSLAYSLCLSSRFSFRDQHSPQAEESYGKSDPKTQVRNQPEYSENNKSRCQSSHHDSFGLHLSEAPYNPSSYEQTNEYLADINSYGIQGKGNECYRYTYNRNAHHYGSDRCSEQNDSPPAQTCPGFASY